MAFVTDKGFVDIPPVTEKYPPNPLLGYDGCRTAPPSSVASSDCMSQSSLTHRVLLYDQRCLVTGGVSDQLQACHLISTIRMDESNRQEKSNLKKRVVRGSLFPIRSVANPFMFRKLSSPDYNSELGTSSLIASQTVLPVSVFY